jgi:hypothetical protein
MIQLNDVGEQRLTLKDGHVGFKLVLAMCWQWAIISHFATADPTGQKARPQPHAQFRRAGLKIATTLFRLFLMRMSGWTD